MDSYDYYEAPPTPPLRLREDWLAKRVDSYITRFALLPRGGSVLVGVSGGRDSMALLRLLAGLGYWELTAAHCNFRLRGSASAGDEQFTRSACAALGIGLHVARFETRAWCRSQGVGIEEGARRLRYDWFETLRAAHGYTRIAVAHHADDQAETMLLNAARGAGLRGLRGMPLQNGPIVRPLLGTPRQALNRWIEEQGMAYREDATNAEDAHARNVIRHHAIPALLRVNRGAIAHMSRASAALEEAREALLEESERLWGKVDRPIPAAGEMLLTHAAQAVEHARLLRFWLRERMAHAGFSPQQASDASRWLEGCYAGRSIRTRVVELRAERQGLWLGPTTAEAQSTVEYHRGDTLGPLRIHEEACGGFADAAALRRYASRGEDVAVLDATRLHYPLRLRPWRAGDRIRPLGMRGRKLVSDVLTDAHVASHARGRVMVVESGGEIAWVVGVRVSGDFALSPTSRQAVVLDASTLLRLN